MSEATSRTELISFLEQALSGAQTPEFEEIGMVVQVGDLYCTVYGLQHAVYGEQVIFDGGNRGIIFNLNDDAVTVFLVDAHIPVHENEVVRRTGSVFKIDVGMSLLSRVVNAVGRPIDGRGQLEDTQESPIEVAIPGIVERSPVNEPLETGTLAVDALVPIGRGQRELIVGNRGTGKTSLAIETIIHQRHSDRRPLCVYVAIGQRKANVARIVHELEERHALEYTCVVVADAADTALNRYLAPYVGCTIAEYFREQGNDVLIIYDDLTNHAIAYREMSLLMRRPPGREAYPGDVFYLHSRLLERAGKLTTGASITALPIVQIQADDLTAYIPTNLISITDGQIFLDTKLFNAGVRPAVNVELSVSRVGGAAQTKAVNKMAKALRLELAQYHELVGFAQFGTELDQVSQEHLARGAIVVELLKQERGVAYTFVDEALILFALRNNYLDALPLDQVRPFARSFARFIKSVYPLLYQNIQTTKMIDDSTATRLASLGEEFQKLFNTGAKLPQ